MACLAKNPGGLAHSIFRIVRVIRPRPANLVGDDGRPTAIAKFVAAFPARLGSINFIGVRSPLRRPSARKRIHPVVGNLDLGVDAGEVLEQREEVGAVKELHRFVAGKLE